jgi:phthiodiolone/phenolphthiodiolone dimycocerosates ketoreductase
VSRFRVGLMDSILAGRPSVDTYSRVSYRAAVVDRVGSYWVPDHINGQTPRPLWDPKYTAAARLLRSPDGRWKTGLATLLPFNRVVRGLKRL